MAMPEFSVLPDLVSKAEPAGVDFMAATDSLGSKGFIPPTIMGHEMAYPFPNDKSVLIVHVMQDGLRSAERGRLCKSGRV